MKLFTIISGEEIVLILSNAICTYRGIYIALLEQIKTQYHDYYTLFESYLNILSCFNLFKLLLLKQT
jgi:hypothetical protein